MCFGRNKIDQKIQSGSLSHAVILTVFYLCFKSCLILQCSGLQCTRQHWTGLQQRANESADRPSGFTTTGAWVRVRSLDTCGGIIRMMRRILKQIVDARIVTVMWTTVIHKTGFQIRTSDALVRKSPFYDPNMWEKKNSKD